MKPADDDLFKPLSAKTGRKGFSTGGREQTDGTRRCGEGRKWQQFLQKRATDQARRAKGTLK
jgi:hypothetical protein